MKLRTILWKEIWLRKARLVSGLLAITLGIAVIVGIRSFALVSERAVKIKLDNLGANILVLPQAASVNDYYTADIDAPTFPEEYVERVATSMLPGVDNLSPKLTRRLEVAGVSVILTGVLPASELAAKPIWQSAGLAGDELALACGVSPETKGGPSYVDERLQRKPIDTLAPEEVLVGSVVAERLGLTEGSTVVIQGREFRAARILPVTGTADNTPFSVTTTADAGGNWLSATPLSGTTPASITITANPTGLGAGTYYGTVTIQGPGNTQTISVDFVVADPTVLPVLETDARSLSFSVQEGAPSPQPRYLDVEPNYVLRTATASTESGGGWLSVDGGGAAPLFRVHANTIGLTADTYRGMVTVTAQGFVSAQVPVTLTVWKQAPVFFVSPSSLNFTVEYGGTAHLETVTVESQGVPVQFSVQRVTADGYPWLNGTALSDITPTTMPIAPTSTGVLPGTRHGSVTITGAGQSISIPITLTVTSNASMPPLIGAIVNAGSGIAGGVAPGEILAVHGVGIGSGQPAGLALDADGKVITSLSGARLLFDGIAAPLTYASVSQINAVVPYEVTGKDVTNIEVEYTGIRSRAWGVPVLAAAPAIFTLDYTGRGPAAVLNQDNSVNVPSNPAPRGSVIQIYGTGEGLTSPPSVTGTITQMDLKTPLLPVSVRIGGIDANLEYKGSAPDLVAGVIQVNAVVPYDVVPGPSVPIVLTVGGSRSPDGATIAVQ